MACKSCVCVCWADIKVSDLIYPICGCGSGSGSSSSSSTSSSQCKYTWYFYLRVFYLLWTLSNVIAQLIIQQGFTVYFCYLTQWGWWSMMIHFASAVAVTVRYKPETDCDRKQLDWVEKFCVASFGVSTTFALVVTLLFWVLLFDASTYTSTQAWFFTLNTHALNAVIACSNVFISRMKPKPIHVLFSAIVALLYVPTNAVCSVSNQENVYTVWPWLQVNTSTVILAFGGILGGIVLFFVAYGLTHARDKCCGDHLVKITDLPLEGPDKESALDKA